MSDTTKLAPCWRLAVTVTEAGVLPRYEGPVLASIGGGVWQVYGSTMYFPFVQTFDAYRAINDDGTTGPLVTRSTTTRREWAVKPPDDETEIMVLQSDGRPYHSTGDDTQEPHTSKLTTTHEIAWTTPEEFAALLGGQREVTEGMVSASFSEFGTYAGMAAHINAALREAL